jgi:hypothetical protein
MLASKDQSSFEYYRACPGAFFSAERQRQLVVNNDALFNTSYTHLKDDLTYARKAEKEKRKELKRGT